MLDLAAADFISVSGIFKALAAEEGAERVVYFEASNEARDQQNEVVLAKALADSAAWYLQYGNLDIDHVTQIGAKAGIPDYNLFEIGRPVDVRVAEPRTFVKAMLYRGDGPAAEKANQVWDSLTGISPPARWFPSVGGAVLEKGQEFDPATQTTHTVVKKVRWTNVGLSRTPVNQTVPTVSTVPIGALAKSWSVGGFDMTKALEAGAGTDMATREGGGALARQSLDRRVHNYWDFRDRMAGEVRKKRVRLADAGGMVKHAHAAFGMAKADAAEMTERFLADLKAAPHQQRTM